MIPDAFVPLLCARKALAQESDRWVGPVKPMERQCLASPAEPSELLSNGNAEILRQQLFVRFRRLFALVENAQCRLVGFGRINTAQDQLDKDVVRTKFRVHMVGNLE